MTTSNIKTPCPFCGSANYLRTAQIGLLNYKDGRPIKTLKLTSEPPAPKPASDNDELIEKIHKGHKNGLTHAVIAQRLKCSPVYVQDVIARGLSGLSVA